jgi:N6-L-threonylcarbamoyladenine synthase
MKILGLDTSCDDTAIALLENGKILAEAVSTQLEHREWGGVVPEIASRAHLRNILPVTEVVLADAKITQEEVDLLSVTVGPGLIGALLVGIHFAKGWSLARNIPLLGINHLQAHIWAAEVESEPLIPPFLSLIVSGGHTLLVKVEGVKNYHILGQTLDDAAGEVLDKIGRLLGLNYPCGAVIERMAEKGNPQAVKLPRGMQYSGDLNFSFSGLKTSARLFLERNPEYCSGEKQIDFLASLQEAVLDILVDKSIKAIERERLDTLVLGGGVSANTRLRMKFLLHSGLKLRAPSPKMCTDNGVMVAHLAGKLWDSGERRQNNVQSRPSLSLDNPTFS